MTAETCVGPCKPQEPPKTPVKGTSSSCPSNDRSSSTKSQLPKQETTPIRLRMKRFEHGISPMDLADRRSKVYSSEFRGLYNLAGICSTLYVISSAGSNLYRHGILLDARLFVSVFLSWDFLEVLSTFAAQVLFSFSAFLPVYLYAWGAPRLVINSLHHILQFSIFAATVACVWVRNWNVVHVFSAFIECLVLMMKMHSYIRTQIELARRDNQKPNPNVKDYTMYLLYPTLVYEPNYPRTEKIRWLYVLEKVLQVTIGMAMFYFIVTDYVQPALDQSAVADPTFLILHLLLPFLGSYFMVWFIIFECICNGVAEVTFYADRDFYDDWWNSTTFDEFARKWNKPVHEFLLRHVYLESLENYRLSRRSATALTFLVSSVFHELVFVIIFRAIRLYFFFVQMAQVLIIMFGRGLRGTQIGNYIFWFSMILGPPMQAVLYCREQQGGDSIFLSMLVPVTVSGLIGIVTLSTVLTGSAASKKLEPAPPQETK